MQAPDMSGIRRMTDALAYVAQWARTMRDEWRRNPRNRYQPYMCYRPRPRYQPNYPA